jgi:hypothetical protein
MQSRRNELVKRPCAHNATMCDLRVRLQWASQTKAVFDGMSQALASTHGFDVQVLRETICRESPAPEVLLIHLQVSRNGHATGGKETTRCGYELLRAGHMGL